jgi:enamine deaminase RidA (YjgF/YER057c/UK114 family)
MKTIKKEKTNFPGLYVVSLKRPFGMEYFITATLDNGESPNTMLEKIIEYTSAHNAVIISQDIFGLPGYGDNKNIVKYRTQITNIDWPITCLDNNSNPSGTYVWAISGACVTPIRLSNNVIGNIVEDTFTRFVRLGGLTANRKGQALQQQTQEVLEQMETALQTVKMDFSNVIRTWFYNEDITSCYKEFNLARNKFFQERGIFKGLIPASTGVGKDNNIDTAIVAGALAIKGKVKDINVLALPSPLQRPAMDYGSSFSRAVELTLPDHRRLYISGTASIEQDGKTVYPDDTPAQVNHSMKVIDAILKSRRMDWSDITRAVAFFKHAKDAALLREFCFTHEIPVYPVIVTVTDICRDDLLFEIEVDAIK